MKIVVLDGYAQNPGDLSWDGFKRLGDFTCYDRTPKDKTIERIADSEIVITNKTVIDKEVFDSCKNIKYIGLLSTGYNVIDLDCANKRGIPVTNIPSYSTMAVAQFTTGLMLSLAYRFGAHSQSVLSGEWSKNPDFSYHITPLVELTGKTLGIIGFGKIGQSVFKIATAMGLNVIVYTRTKRESDICSFVSFDELLKRSDIVSLHCPLFKETEKLIDKEALSKMKQGAFLINTARGPLIDEDAVCEALENGKLAGFAADVVSKEPINPDNPLLRAKNVILTPHIAWAAKETRARLMEIAVSNLESYLNGKTTNNVLEL